MPALDLTALLRGDLLKGPEWNADTHTTLFLACHPPTQRPPPPAGVGFFASPTLTLPT